MVDHHLLLKLSGEGIVIISGYFHPEIQQELKKPPPLPAPCCRLWSFGGLEREVPCLAQRAGREGKWLSFQSPITAFLPKLSKKDAGWK